MSKKYILEYRLLLSLHLSSLHQIRRASMLIILGLAFPCNKYSRLVYNQLKMEKHEDDASILSKLDLHDMEQIISQVYHQEGLRGHSLNIWDRLRNRRIGSKRRPMERVFAVLKQVFDRGRVLVTTVGRVRVKMMFSRLCFHMVQLRSLGVS